MSKHHLATFLILAVSGTAMATAQVAPSLPKQPVVKPPTIPNRGVINPKVTLPRLDLGKKVYVRPELERVDLTPSVHSYGYLSDRSQLVPNGKYRIYIYGKNLSGKKLANAVPAKPADCNDRCSAFWDVYANDVARARWTMVGNDFGWVELTERMTERPFAQDSKPGVCESEGSLLRNIGGILRRGQCASAMVTLEDLIEIGLVGGPMTVNLLGISDAFRKRPLGFDGEMQTDKDGDGREAIWARGDDCDDNDANRYPGNIEVADEGHDEDCDATTYGSVDEDGDGFDWDVPFNVGEDGTVYRGDDCNDGNIKVNPAAWDIMNGNDDDCDGKVDEDDPDSPNFEPPSNP